MATAVTLKQLELLASVIAAGSITKASRRIGLSQPSISQHLAKMEETLGVQLILRNRAENVELTLAGEFWFKTATEMMRSYNIAMEDHAGRFSRDWLSIRMGTTPSLGGRLTGTMARVALEVDDNAQFELCWGLDSGKVAEQLRLHKINCAIVNIASVNSDRSSYRIEPLFKDFCGWVVPSNIPDNALRDALARKPEPFQQYPALRRYVALTADSPMQASSNGWYRSFLPSASPAFRAMTYSTAFDLVQEGLATAHCPLSILPNLSNSVRESAKWFVLEEFSRDVALVMPKHLLSLPAYAKFYDKFRSYIQSVYLTDLISSSTRPVSALLQ